MVRIRQSRLALPFVFQRLSIVIVYSAMEYPVSCECAAEPAIHPAGGDQLSGNYSCLCQSF